MPEPSCHYCDRSAEAECPTCGRFYCPDHGEDVCLRCLAPESAVPPPLVYRGSLVALAVGSLVAIFLAIAPPESKSKTDQARAVATPTAAIGATATPTRAGTPARTNTPAASGTAGASASATAPPTTTPAPERTYTVAAGDTLSGIAVKFDTTVEAILALNPGVRPEALQAGAVLKIPPAP